MDYSLEIDGGVQKFAVRTTGGIAATNVDYS
jgi:hypothetical protein